MLVELMQRDVRAPVLSVLLLVATGAVADASPPPAGQQRNARWLAGGLPLVSVGKRGLRAPGSADCAWVQVDSRWRAFDAYGATLGEGAVTQIDEPGCVANLGALETNAALFQSASAQAPRPTVRWAPTTSERAAFLRLAAPTGDPFTDGEVLFFIGVGGTRFAASGGRRLVIARLDRGSFRLLRTGRDVRDQSDRLLAVVDLDGDDVPEIVSQHVDGDVWRADVYRFDGTRWRRVASGLGGDFV